jgi:S-DNA-T family DNA segregation ATPase FtsK/SpoIIIE
MSKSNIDLSMLSSIKDDRYISLKDCLKDIDLDKYEIPICLGRDSNKNIVFKDLVDIKSILMSGMTHSGKSVFINSFISTILLTKEAEEVKFIMIDPTITELSAYNGIRHLLYPVCVDMQKCLQLIEWCVEEMERRKKESKKKPYIVIVVDEFSDLVHIIDGSYSKIEEIAKSGSEVGMYMLLSSSSRTKEVFTNTAREVLPVRIVGCVPTEEDSKNVIGELGAEELLGNGDMIFKDLKSGEKIRVQTPFISTKDTESIVKKLTTRECLCTNPKCMECLLVNCTDDNCKIHTKENKRKARKRVYYPIIKKLIESGVRITPEVMEKEFHMGYMESGNFFNEFWDDELENFPYVYKRIEEEIEKNGSVDTLFLQKEFTMSALHAMRLKKIIDKKYT